MSQPIAYLMAMKALKEQTRKKAARHQPGPSRKKLFEVVSGLQSYFGRPFRDRGA